MKKRILSLILALALACSLLVFPASAADPTSGTCGENVTWTLDENGVMTISGTGRMDDYSTVTDRPWNDVKDSITSVVVEEGVTYICNYAFQTCTNLESLSTAASVQTIGIYAFSGCSKLDSLEFAAGLRYLNEGSFLSCTALQEVSLPDSVTSIGNYAFEDCSSLKSVNIPDSVTSIGGYAFDKCSSLTSVNIPDSVTYVGIGAFNGCDSLTDVYYGGTEEQWNAITIGENNDPLTSATIHYTEPQPAVLDEGDYDTLHWVLTDDGTVTISGTGTIWSGLKDSWSQWGSMVKTIVIESGVTTIGSYAFYSCYNLTSIIIPDSVTSIGDYAFRYCSSLTNVIIPENVTSIGYQAFESCTALTSVNILASVTSIGNYAFSGCSSLTNINIPDSVTSIGSYAFSGCSSLTNINIPDSVTSIGGHAFSSCKSLTSVTIPESVTSIGENTFRYCNAMTEITVDPENTKYQSVDGVLFNKSGTQLIVCPAGKTGVFNIPVGTFLITDYAFENCTALKGVTIPESVTSIGQIAFAYCSSLTELMIPNSVTSIGGGAFFDCSGLKSVIIPEGITSINHFFQYCSSLESVTIPASITSIIQGSFLYCNSLKDVYYGGSEDQWAAISIDSKNNEPLFNATIHFGASTPGKIESDPADVTAPVGGTASFTVVASGDVVSYQWQVSENGTDWANCEGAAATLELTAAEGMDGYQYRCVVTDVNGDSVISNPATLTVAQPVVITASPSDSATMTGRVSVFGVMAQGEGLSYQWQYKKPGGGWKNCSAVTQGFNTQFLMVQGVTGSTNRDGYQYRCVVTDAYGNTATSDAALLTVFAIKTQPKAATATADGSAVFSVVATGNDVQYQWQYKKPGGPWKNCSSATQGYNTATLTVQGVTGKTNRNGYQYRCVLTSGSMSLTSKAVKLTVN